jgi:hypothetical protein
MALPPTQQCHATPKLRFLARISRNWWRSKRSERDKGIDLRYTTITGSTIIVQCKHYVGSTLSTLLSHLKKIELPKIKRLSPARYVLVTSVSLSPDNKTKIRNALQPYVHSDSDVLGAGDLDGLLSKHTEIERDNFKLWMTNTNVIDRVLHNAKICPPNLSSTASDRRFLVLSKWSPTRERSACSPKT